MTAPGVLPAQRCHRLQHFIGGLWSLRWLFLSAVVSPTQLPPRLPRYRFGSPGAITERHGVSGAPHPADTSWKSAPPWGSCRSAAEA